MGGDIKMAKTLQDRREDSSLEAKLRVYSQEASIASQPDDSDKTSAAIRVCSMALGAVLGLAQPSLATIQYSGPKNTPLSVFSLAGYWVDFDGVGQTRDIKFTYIPTYSSGPFYSTSRKANKASDKPNAKGLVSPKGNGHNLCRVFVPGSAQALIAGPSAIERFDQGEDIRASLSPWGSSWFFGLNGNAALIPAGCQFNSQTGYIGVRIPVTGAPGHYYYGWIQYQGHSNGTGTIIDWAYENTPDMAIAAGAAGYAAPVPALDEWGALILFALLAGAGAAVTRRKRGSAARDA